MIHECGAESDRASDQVRRRTRRRVGPRGIRDHPDVPAPGLPRCEQFEATSSETLHGHAAVLRPPSALDRIRAQDEGQTQSEHPDRLGPVIRDGHRGRLRVGANRRDGEFDLLAGGERERRNGGDPRLDVVGGSTRSSPMTPMRNCTALGRQVVADLLRRRRWRRVLPRARESTQDRCCSQRATHFEHLGSVVESSPAWQRFRRGCVRRSSPGGHVRGDRWSPAPGRESACRSDDPSSRAARRRRRSR